MLYTAAAFLWRPLRVTAERMSHPVETFGFRLEHGGATLAYSADTGETDALTRLARDADLLLCEASLVEPGSQGGHQGAVAFHDAPVHAGVAVAQKSRTES